MTRVLAGIACLALLTFLYVPSGTSAAAGTVVAKDMTCMVLDADGGIAVGNQSLLMSTPGGNSMIRCTVKDVPNSTGRAVHYNYENTGMACMTAAGATTDWHETISASGNATLTCRMKN